MYAKNNQISGRQATRLLVFELLGYSALLVPAALAKTAGRDGIFSVALGVAAGFLYLYLLKPGFGRMQGSYSECLITTFGPATGNLIKTGYLVFFLLLAGRVAEEIVFNTKTTGAANDIERANALARAMIAQYGMSDRFGMMSLESIENKYLDGRAVSNCSDETKTQLDAEIVKLLDECHKKAETMLLENRVALDRISEFLIEKENITGDQFMEILNSYIQRY